MPFVGIISKENDSNFIKNAISKNSKESNFEIININNELAEASTVISYSLVDLCKTDQYYR